MSDKQSSLLRGILIIEKVVQSDKPVSSALLAEELGLPRATVHRIALQLKDEGFLQWEDKGKKLTAGNRIRTLARNTLANSVLYAHRNSILKALSEEIGETCNLTALDGNEILYLDRVETNWPYRIHLPIGSHLPLHCTATGKLFLANMKKTARKRMLDSLDLAQFTAQTIFKMDLLEQHLEGIASEGIALDNEEYIDGMVALAVPVIGENNQMCFAIAVHAPLIRKTLLDLRQYIPALRHAASRLALLEC